MRGGGVVFSLRPPCKNRWNSALKCKVSFVMYLVVLNIYKVQYHIPTVYFIKISKIWVIECIIEYKFLPTVHHLKEMVPVLESKSLFCS